MVIAANQDTLSPVHRNRCNDPTRLSARLWIERPRHELVDACVGVSLGDRFEGGGEIGEWFDIVDLGGSDERCDASPCLSTLVMTGEQCVFARVRQPGIDLWTTREVL